MEKGLYSKDVTVLGMKKLMIFMGFGEAETVYRSDTRKILNINCFWILQKAFNGLYFYV